MSSLFDDAGVRKALSLLVAPGQVFEVRALEAGLPGNYRTGTISGYFDNPDACLKELKKLTKAKGIYFTLNPVDPSLLARRANRLDYVGRDDTTKDHHILRLRELLIDVDYVRPSGISTTDAEKEVTRKKGREVYAYLKKERGWPLPVVADSGNAYHLVYRIDLSCEDDGLLEKALDALANRFDGEGVELDQGVHNPSRIVKLYGTLACKGDNMPDRPWRYSKILNVPDPLQVVTAEQLRVLVNDLLPKEPEKRKASASKNVERDNKPGKAQVREMLAVIPKRPHYHDWFPICAAVGDALPLEDAIELLNEWSPEEEPGEYAKKLQSGFEKIHVGTLFHIAKQHGWKPPPRAQAEKEPLELPPPPPPYVPPPLDLLPQRLQKFVRDGAVANDVDTSFIFLPLLSELGACIGISRSVRIKEGWIQPPILWTSVVAPSGDGKGPGMETAIRPQLLHEMELKRENDEKKADYEKELTAWEATDRKKRLTARPEKPTEQVCWMDDATLEAVARRLNENARGILLAKAELTHWFGSFDQYRDKGGSDLARWLQLYDGILFAVDRVTGDRCYRILNPRICIASGVQPEPLGRLLTSEYFDRGLPARVLWSMPTRKRPRKYTKKVVSRLLQAEVAQLLSKLRSLQPDEITTRQDKSEQYEGDEEDVQEQKKQDRLTPKLLSLSPKAEEIFTAFYDEVGQIIFDAPPRMAAQWSKLIGAAARLALVGQLAHDPNAKEISGEIMKHAVALARWFGNEAERIYAQLAETPEQRARRELIEFIERRGRKVTVREVTQLFRPLKNNRDEAERQLSALVRARHGEWKETKGARGPATREFQLLPASTSTGYESSPSVASEPVDVDSPNSQKSEASTEPDSQENAISADSDTDTDVFQTSTASTSTGFTISPSILPKPVDVDDHSDQEHETLLGPAAHTPQPTPKKLRL